MKISVVSDLHLDIGGGMSLVNEHGADVLIIAGDTINGVYGKFNSMKEFLKGISDNYPIILWIPGNHEWYGNFHSKEYVFEKYQTKLLEEGITNIIFSDRISEKIRGVNFLGTTLWTDMKNGDPMVLYDADHYMNDYKMIRGVRGEGKRFTPDAQVWQHRLDKQFLENELLNDGNFFVFTHHSPVLETLRYSEHSSGDNLDYAYGCTDMAEIMMDNDIKILGWVHGHSHTRFTDRDLFKFPMYSNCRGYSGQEARSFKELIIEV